MNTAAKNALIGSLEVKHDPKLKGKKVTAKKGITYHFVKLASSVYKKYRIENLPKKKVLGVLTGDYVVMNSDTKLLFDSSFNNAAYISQKDIAGVSVLKVVLIVLASAGAAFGAKKGIKLLIKKNKK